MDKKRFFIIFSFIILIVFLIFGYSYVYEEVMVNIFNKEIDNVIDLDILSDDYNISLKTTGKYRSIEKLIKDYYLDIRNDIIDIENILKEDKLKSILSYDNYMEDMSMDNSISYVLEKQGVFNDKIADINKLLSDDYIKSNITDNCNDEYYIKLYNKKMNSKKNKDNISKIKKSVDRTDEYISYFFNSTLDVLNFLKREKDNWVLEDGEVKFQTNQLYDEYTLLLTKLKKGYVN